MKLSLNWLQEYLNEQLDADVLAEDLTMLGIEVENVTKISPSLDNIVVARIDEIKPHPNADRLTLCQVFDGQMTRSIVCGAPNIKVGDIAPLALAGAHLANGLEIKKTKIRGEVSDGMLCSETELGIGQDKSGILILSDSAMIGEPLKTAFPLEDVIFDISISPNRGDLLCVKGIAREICALKKISFDEISFLKKIDLSYDKNLDKAIAVHIEDDDLCPRYGYGVAEGIAIGPSPFWMRYRLSHCGIRPINNIVDITNYIMLDLGHPMHAFDRDTLEGSKIIVRKSRKGEAITALDGSRHTLDDSHLVIADARKPVAVAGVMGGEETEVKERTRSIVFECAYFNPKSVRKTSRLLNLASESSYRFERGVDASDIEESILKAYELVEKNLSGKHRYSSALIQGKKILDPKKISFHAEKCCRLLGIEIAAGEMEDILEGLGFRCEKKTGESSSWIVPCHRMHDVEREIDLIEEIARVYGYTHIPEERELVVAEHKAALPMDALTRKLSDAMTSQGFSEVVSYCFLSKKESDIFSSVKTEVLSLKNPISEDLRYMRTSLVPSLCGIVATNLNYGFSDIKIFEIAKTYHGADKKWPKEKTHLSFAICGFHEPHNPFEKKRPYDFFDIKGVYEIIRELLAVEINITTDARPSYMEEETVSLCIGKETVGFLGRVERTVLEEVYDIKRDVFYAEISLDGLPDKDIFEQKFVSLVRYPSVTNDISFVVDKKVSHADIYKNIIKLNIKELENVEIYDIFEGKNIPKEKKSMTYALLFRSDERTLKGEEVRERVDRILDSLKKSFHIQLRTL